MVRVRMGLGWWVRDPKPCRSKIGSINVIINITDKTFNQVHVDYSLIHSSHSLESGFGVLRQIELLRKHKLFLLIIPNEVRVRIRVRVNVRGQR